jgi:hypothetical protein
MSATDQDSEHLRLLSIFHYVMAAMTATWATLPIIHLIIGIAIVLGKFGDAPKGGPSPALMGWFFIFVAGTWMIVGWSLATGLVLAGRYLSQRRKHLFCLIVAGLVAAMCMPFGTVLGVFTIIVLIRPSVKDSFDA